jgi:type III secretion protein T
MQEPSPYWMLMVLAVLGARLGTALMMFPLFADSSLPLTVRAAIVSALSLCLLPVLGPAQWGALAQLDGLQLSLLLAKEVGLGFALGLVGSTAFWAVHAAGAIIENQAGLSMATTLDPLAGQEDSLLGGFLVQVLSVMFLAAGGLLALLGVLYESFRIWPLAQIGPSLDPALWLRVVDSVLRTVMDLALRVAAPFVLLMLLAEFGLGLLGRYAPQFQVFFLALPVKAALLLVLLLVYTLVLASGNALPDVAATIRGLF